MAFPDPNEQRPFVGDISAQWQADGVKWFSAENAAGERGVQAVDVVDGAISLWRDAAGGTLTFPQATANRRAAFVSPAGDRSYALFDRTTPADNYVASPSNLTGFDTEAAHSVAGVVMSTNTAASGLFGRYVNNTADRSYVGRPGSAPLERFGLMRGANGIYLPISAAKRIAFVASFDPSVGTNGTVYLMIDGVTATPVAIESGTGGSSGGLSFGSALPSGSIAWAGQVWEMWAMPYNWFAKPADATAALQAYRRRQAWRTFVRELYGIDTFPVG